MGLTESAAVPPGYKQTEVGVIPEDWELVSFSQIMEFQNGVNAGKNAYGTGIPFINVLEVISKTHLKHQDIPGKISLSNSVFGSYAVRRGDFFFNRTSETQEEVGLAAVYDDDQPVVFGGFVIRGRPTTKRLNLTYAGYGLRAPSIRTQIISRGQGAIRANIGQSDLKQIWVPLPPLKEQQAIAEALSDADALIEGLEALIAKKRQLKQGAMQKLVTGESRLQGFNDAWKVKRLGEVATMRSGGTPSTSVAAYYGGGIPWVSISDMTKAGKFIVITDESLTAVGLENSAAQMFPAGTVLYAMYASLGECSISRIPLSTSQAILGIQTKTDLNNEFLYYSLIALKPKVKAMGQQGTQANLNAGMVRAFEVHLPEIDEQIAISAVLSDMDAEIAALEGKLAKARRVKAGMMQDLLTGRVRLV